MCQWPGREGIGLGLVAARLPARAHFLVASRSRLFDGLRLDVRVSLRTVDRLEVRNRAAAFTASTRHVVKMLNERMKAADARPTEDALQAIP